jgi:mRNA interferase HigB
MLREFAVKHADALPDLQIWFRTAKRADWSKTHDVIADFPKTDFVGDRAIFNIHGNRYRLIAIVEFERKRVLVRWIGTHAEYDRLTEKEIREL